MTVPDLLPVGTQAPDFTLAASDGQLVTLSALRGHKHVVLIFYVGDNTPDCNRQLSSLRDDMPELEGLDILVVGINPASLEEHARYGRQLGLNFPLLHDARRTGCRAIWGAQPGSLRAALSLCRR